MDDLFGHTPQQKDMFEPAEAPRLSPPIKHTPDTIRAEMHRLLAEVRGAPSVPWPPRELQSHRAMFPYMAEWLKGGEGDQLLLEFRTELQRLGASSTE
jgi:hypothetical protein